MENKNNEITVTVKTEVVFNLIAPFKVGEKDYAALIPKQDVYLFKYREIPAEESIEFFAIAEKGEYEAARDAFDRLLKESDIAND